MLVVRSLQIFNQETFPYICFFEDGLPPPPASLMMDEEPLPPPPPPVATQPAARNSYSLSSGIASEQLQYGLGSPFERPYEWVPKVYLEKGTLSSTCCCI